MSVYIDADVIVHVCDIDTGIQHVYNYDKNLKMLHIFFKTNCFSMRIDYYSLKRELIESRQKKLIKI